MKLIDQLFARAAALLASGNSIDQAARKISAEFEATGYVSKGKLWASFMASNGQQDTRVLA